jgi:hypothetical protein
MTNVLLTPIDLSTARRVGKTRFRKQILPLTTINYKGRRITFDKPYLMNLARSFKQRAYDQVPFVLANERNEHHMDPRLFEGEVKDLIFTGDGLDMVVDLTREGAALVGKNPRLGVSARIVQGLAKADGRKFTGAIQHVLATMDPRITGLRPWQAVDLSGAENFEVVDLTAETYSGRNQDMANSAIKLGSVDKKTRTATLDLSKLSDDEFEALLDLGTDEVEIDPETGLPVEKPAEDEVDPDELEEGLEEEEADPEAVDPANGQVPQVVQGGQGSNPRKRKTTTTVEEEALDPGGNLGAEAGAVANLSNEFAQWRSERATSEWKTRRKELAGAGVPPFLLDLAEPVVSSPEVMTIDLSESGGGKIDPKDVINKMLDGMTGMIDLTPEMGHSVESGTIGKADPDAAYLSAWTEMYGE